MGTEARQLMEQAGKRTFHDEGYAGECVRKWDSQGWLKPQHKMDPIQHPHVKKVTAMLLENQMEHTQNLTEDTLSSNTGYFTKYTFPVLRRVWPNLIANQIVSVQPGRVHGLVGA